MSGLNNKNDFEDQQHLIQQDQPFQTQVMGEKMQQQMRMGFIRKVLGILTVQLIITFGFCLSVTNNKDYFKFMISTPGRVLFYACLITNIVVMLMLMCSKTMAKQVPLNYGLLGLFTISESVIVGFICSHSKTELVLMALFMTIAICLGLTLYAMTTDTDFTMQGGMLFIFGMAMLAIGLCVSFTHNKTIHIIYSGLSVILLGIYLIYDVQLIAGGKQHELSYDDYIVGSLMLYTDIVSIFIHILNILNSTD